jgi:hypothetical protein
MRSFNILIPLFLTAFGSLQAAWEPEYIFAENYAPNNPKLARLEQKVVSFLKNSWCSEKKAKLIIELVVNTKPQTCVDIGAFTGSSTLPMLAGLQYLGKGRAYVIDAWSNQEAIRGLPENDPNRAWWAQLDMKSIKNHFSNTMKQWSLTPYFQLLHMTSAQAVSQVPSIDFLHLDGNISEAGALLDSQMYLPKVVPGGYVLLSNALVMIGGQPSKSKALWPLFDSCDLVCEIENGNVLLFKKR